MSSAAGLLDGPECMAPGETVPSPAPRPSWARRGHDSVFRSIYDPCQCLLCEIALDTLPWWRPVSQEAFATATGYAQIGAVKRRL
jgi:hypothetical protein